MKKLFFHLTLLFLLGSSANAQSVEFQADKDENTAQQKSLLLFDLQSLETKSDKLSEPLAKALAKAEIADTVWTLDQERAAILLREAYELTLPNEEDQTRLRDKPAGSIPIMFDSIDRARGDIRNRVLEIARRDKTLSRQLSQLGEERLGKFEGHFRNAVSARKAFEEGDKESAAQYVLQSIEADPTQITAATVINEIAAQDRTLADRLIIQYIERLRAFPLSNENQSDSRTFNLLAELVRNFRYSEKPIQPPGVAVMKSYVSFMLESLNKLEQSYPGYLRRARLRLMSVWVPLQQFAPELTGVFMDLEKRSRRPGDDSTLPTATSLEERNKDRYEKQVKEALESGQSDETIINAAISRGDFNKARKLIDKLADGPKKQQLTEMADERESRSLAAKDDLPGAIRLAEKLNNARAISQVYPVLISRCIANKDQSCAISLTYQAIKQLKRADTSPPIPPEGIPHTIFASNLESDPVLSGLANLALSVMPLNETLALEVLTEVAATADSSKVDTRQGRIGFNANIFKKLAPKNETRVRQVAESFKDPLRQIVALAAIYQWKTEELSKRDKTKK
jgi:hypothetical protein